MYRPTTEIKVNNGRKLLTITLASQDNVPMFREWNGQLQILI